MAQAANSREAELHSLLRDERERSEQHKQLYHTLKDEHGKLKDELALLYQQLKDTVTKNEQIQASKDDRIRRLEEHLQEKQKEIHQLSEEVKSYDPKKIRDSVLEEATSHYEAKIKELHLEADKTREQYNNLHFEHAVLKCKFDSRKTEYSHALECLKLQHLEEIQQLQNKLEIFDKQKLSTDDSTAVELKSARREVLQLNAKLKSVLAECEELRAQNENLTLQMNSTNRTHLKQIADNISNIRTLESEKQKAVMQKEVFEKELNSVFEHRKILNNDLQSSKREILSLRNKLEECEHKCRIMVTNLQVENERFKAEQESDQQLLLTELSNLKITLKEKSAEFESMQQTFAAKEQELQENLMTARQQVWKQSNEFVQEKERMERKFVEFKNQSDQLISELSREAQILGQNLNQCTEAKLELEKQFLAMREQFEAAGKDVAMPPSDMLSKQNLNLENEIKELKEQIHILKASSSTSAAEKGKQISDLLSRQKCNQNYNDETEILQLKLSWEQQKHQFHQRLEALESQLKESKNLFAAEKKQLEEKIQQYHKMINKLKEKLDIHKVKNEELESQAEILKTNVPHETHQQVINRLMELQKRLEEYRRIVAADPAPVGSQSSAAMPDKLLTDIKNIQLRFPVFGGDDMDPKPHYPHEKPHCKRKIYVRRRSVKTRGKDLTSRVSSSISSSSDLDLENL